MLIQKPWQSREKLILKFISIKRRIIAVEIISSSFRLFLRALSVLLFEKFDTEVSFCVWEKENTQTLTQPDASDRLLTRAEIAEYLKIGTTFIEQLRRQGKVPSYRLSSKCIRHKKSDCNVLLDHCFIVRSAKGKKIKKP